MPKYIIERDVPGAGDMTPEQLQGISAKSCQVVSGLDTEYHWLHSYVAGDKIYCVHIAPNEEAIRQHAEQGGFPANKITRISSVIDPSTAEGD